MRTVHRVAWRMEKPRLVTFERVTAWLLFLVAFLYATGWWEPSRWAAVAIAVSLGCSYMADDAGARAEYREYLRFKAVLP